MFHNYPYTDFHELNLDWFISKFKEVIDAAEQIEPIVLAWLQTAYDDGKFDDIIINWQTEFADSINQQLTEFENDTTTLIEKVKPHILQNVQTYYIDGLNGSDENDGLTSAYPFKTIDKALSMFNNGVSNLKCTFIESGTYEIGNTYGISGGALHLETVSGIGDVTITSASEKLIAYATHLNFIGDSNNNLIIDIPTVRFDGGDFWGDHCHMTGSVSLNGCGARLRGCILDKRINVNHCNIVIDSGLTLNNVDKEQYAFSVSGGIAYISNAVTLAEQTPLPANSAVFAAYGGGICLANNVTFNTLTNKYEYGVRCFNGYVISRTQEQTAILEAANNTHLFTGSFWA